MTQTKRLLAVALAAATIGANAQIIVGHRGSLWGVENTADAFVAGAGAGFEALECDIRRSSDGVFVVSHDSSFKRLGGPDTEIADMTASDIAQITLHQVREECDYDATPATLEEFLDICLEHGVAPVVEIKRCSDIYSNNDDPADCDYRGVPALMSLIESKGLADQTVIISFMAGVLDNIRAGYPDAQLQFLTEDDWKPWVSWCAERNIEIDVYYPLVSPELVTTFQSLGLRVNAWTVDDPVEFERLQSLGIDMITTNKIIN